MAVTDDDRRRVAERLRMSDERDAAGFDCLLAEVVRGREFCETPCEHCHGRLLDELAGLIEPDEPQVKRELKYRSRCDELGAEMKRQRDALLKLADELEEDACWWEVQTPDDTSGAWRLKDACDRIREALGVTW